MTSTHNTPQLPPASGSFTNEAESASGPNRDTFHVLLSRILRPWQVIETVPNETLPQSKWGEQSVKKEGL